EPVKGMKHASREQRVKDGESLTQRKTCRPPWRFFGSPPLTGPSGVACCMLQVVEIASIINTRSRM
ncbi:MAG: hypothetical protein ABI406_07340, partial [Ktedonobacteraceae bacterium]